MAFQPWEITDDYLGGGGSRTYDNAGSYTDNSDGQIIHVTVYEWRHALSDVIGALLRAGLRIEAVAELPYMDWRGFPGTRCLPTRMGAAGRGASDPAELRRHRPADGMTPRSWAT